MSGGKTENYYASRKPKLLRDFDKTIGIVRRVFVSRYGDQLATTMLGDVRREFEVLIPRIPYPGDSAPRALKTFIVLSAWEISLYKGMKKHGKGVEEIWEVCQEAFKTRLEAIPRLVRYVLRLLFFSNFVKIKGREFAEESQKGQFGEWEFEFVEGDGEDFDWGVNYTKCALHTFMCDQGAEELAPYACLSDIPMSDALGWGTIRTETLAEGFDKCNFRFKKGGKTKISSTVWERL